MCHGFPFPNTLFCRPPLPIWGVLGVSLSFSASPSKQTLTFTLFQVRILLLGSFHVEDGPLANTSAESGGCLAFLSRQRLCIHHTLQTRALALGGKLCPILPAGKSAKKRVVFSLRLLRLLGQREIFWRLCIWEVYCVVPRLVQRWHLLILNIITYCGSD